MKRLRRLQTDQTGLVSIIVTMVLIIVIALIVLGFAQVSRREQRSALDTQLSTQAFYAAESGVNDAKQAIANGYTGAAGDGNKTDCVPDGTFSLPVKIDPVHNVAYTCVLIDQTPDHLYYSPVGTSQAISPDMRFESAPGVLAPAGSISISWSLYPTATTSFTNPYPKFPPQAGAGSWTGTALARMEMTNFSDTTNDYSRNTLNNTTFTAFLYPVVGGGSVNFAIAPNQQGQVVRGGCATAGPNAGTCKVVVNGVNSRHVFLRLGSLYSESSVTIAAYTGLNESGTKLKITGGQAVIDTTGQAQDVLRRIQVRLPLGDQGSPITYAVQAADGICKDIIVGPGFPNFQQIGSIDPACQLAP